MKNVVYKGFMAGEPTQTTFEIPGLSMNFFVFIQDIFFLELLKFISICGLLHPNVLCSEN